MATNRAILDILHTHGVVDFGVLMADMKKSVASIRELVGVLKSKD